MHPKTIRRKLERAARARSFSRVPRNWLTEKNLLSGGSLEEESEDELSTILHLAAQHGSLHLLPRKFLIIENLLKPDAHRKQCCICLAAESGNIQTIPISFMTTEVVLHSCWQDGETVLHKAALRGQLHLLPKNILTKENLTMLSDFGETPLQLAAKAGNLDQIPADILTVKNMRKKIFPDGYTSYHLAVLWDTLHRVPIRLMTADALLDRDGRGGTVLGYATQLGKLEAVPRTCELASRLAEVNQVVVQSVFHANPVVYPRYDRDEILQSARKWQITLTRLALKCAPKKKAKSGEIESGLSSR